MSGPLRGIRVVEIAGLGAAPFCGMVLSDLGAEVIRVDRPPASRGTDPGTNKDSFVDRGRRSISLDLKSPEGIEAVLRLVDTADAIFEAFRPGVVERLGIGPDICLERNERLVYGRMTGWGQNGPLSHAAGHDINYISISGALHAIGPEGDGPVPPLNLVGDYGGGGLLLALGMVAAIFEASRTGKGQVVDAAMSDGAILLMTEIYSQYSRGVWTNRRADNFLDGGAPFYRTYECADGKYVSVGAIEANFYRLLLTKCGLVDIDPSKQWDKALWSQTRTRFEACFKAKSRDDWCALLEGTDACFAPVLDFDEAAAYPHNKERGAFVFDDGKFMPARAPRFSGHSSMTQERSRPIGAETATILTEIGYSELEADRLLRQGIAYQL